MKFKHHRLFPLSFALAVSAVNFAHAQSAVEEPVPLEEKSVAPEEATPAPPVEAVSQQVEKAKMALEAARDAAEAASGDEKAKAVAAVADAEQRLAKAMERAQSQSKEVMDEERQDPENQAARKDRKGRDVGQDSPQADGKKGKGSKAPEQPAAEKPMSEATEKRGKEDMAPREEKETADSVAEGKDEGQPTENVEAPAKLEEKQMPGPEKEATAAEDVELTPEAAVVKKEEEAVAKKADEVVDNTTKKVEEMAETRKLNIKDKDAARDLIRDLIGEEGEVSRAEAQREARLEPRSRGAGRQNQSRGNREEIRGASEFLLRQLSGQAQAEGAPAFFRRPDRVDPRRMQAHDRRQNGSVVSAPIQPRYYHEGRRYVRFDSRNSIPAILLASAALERVRVQPANRVDRFFVNGSNPEAYANLLPPENYRGDDAVVVSYPVSKSSMISSNDIIFAQGSTRFADSHSYDMVMALADAISNPTLKDARFVIEGHASAEGSYDNNMLLSQRRAEAIVRDMVREGIDPERLIPVGYGESEARHSADSPEHLRSLDRNVMVFRTDAGQ